MTSDRRIWILTFFPSSTVLFQRLYQVLVVIDFLLLGFAFALALLRLGSRVSSSILRFLVLPALCFACSLCLLRCLSLGLAA